MQHNTFKKGNVFSVRLIDGTFVNQFCFGDSVPQALMTLSKLYNTPVDTACKCNVLLGNVGHCKGLSIKLIA